MSTEQPLDPELVEQTKRQIRSLVNEIANLAKSELTPEEFYVQFLPRVVNALAAKGGAVWVVEDQGRMALGYQMNLHETGLRESEEAQIQHGRLLHTVLASGEAALVPPRSGAGEADQAANPTPFLLVLAPLKAAEETVGVVEVFQRADTQVRTQQGYLRFLTEMCDRAGEFFKTHQLRHYTDRQVLWSQLEDFTRGVHACLDPRETAYHIANEGRRLIECDRVSVAIRRGKKCRVEAISGQDLLDKRSNLVRLLGKLATAVVASDEPIWYTGDTTDMAPQVEDAVQEYVDESHSKTVAVLPLKAPMPEPDDEKEERDQREYPRESVGALIVEQIEDSRVPEQMIHRVEVVNDHSSIALSNAMEHDNLFLMPLWRGLGKMRWVLRARTLPKTIAVLGGIVGLIVFLLVCPWSFKINAKGTLEPVNRREVFARIDGVVDQIFVNSDSQSVHGPHPLVSPRTSSDGGPVLAFIANDRETARTSYTLVTVPDGNGLFVTNEVRPADTVRTRFGEDSTGLETYWEFTVAQVLDEDRLLLAGGPSEPIGSADRPETIEIWRATLLARMRNTDLNVAIEDNLGKLTTTQKRMFHVRQSLLDSRLLSQEQRSQYSGELMELQEEERSLKKQRDLYQKKARQLEVRSPASGEVTTWKVEKLLKKRPVSTGQALMRVDEVQGPWQLEILMPDRRMGYIVSAWNKARAEERDLMAEFILATDPKTTHAGRVTEMHLAAEVRGDEGNTVMIKVEISDEVKQKLPQPLRPGAGATAKIDCGTRSVGFVLFHDLFDFIRSRIIFPWF